MAYEISISLSFSADHAIRLGDGQMEPRHAHLWQVRVAVACQQLDRIETVLDFHVLERWVEQVVSPARNRCLNDLAPFAGPEGELAINPTAERVAWWIARSVEVMLPRRVSLVKVSVTEAPGCEATYYAR